MDFVARGHAGIAISILLSAGVAIAAWFLSRRALLHLPAAVLSADTATRGASPRRTLLGISLVALGVLLLFLPGPGILLIVVGLVSCDLPRRDRLLRWLLRRPIVLREVNALRARHGRPPLLAPPGERR